jgi:hypothetical protein
VFHLVLRLGAQTLARDLEARGCERLIQIVSGNEMSTISTPVPLKLG